MTNFQKIITEIVNRDPLRQIGVAEKLGVTDAYISNFVTGTRKVSKNIAKKIESVYGIGADDLLSIQKFEEANLLGSNGKSVDQFLKMLDDAPEPITYPSATDQLIKVTDKKKRQKEGITPIEKDAYMWVEYQDLSAVAGRLGGANVEALPDHKKKLVPNEYDSGSYLVVRVDGDSMQTDSEISIPNGSEILIKEYIFDQGEKLPIRDNLWVIVSREGTVFKQIVEHNVQDEYIKVHSYNPRFKDYEIMMEDIIQLFIYRKIVSSRPRIPDITK